MQSPPSRLIIHLRNWSQDSRLFDSKEITRVVKCHPGTQQAAEIRNAIQQAYDSHGNAAQVPFYNSSHHLSTCLQRNTGFTQHF
jgi:hypothetical protein